MINGRTRTMFLLLSTAIVAASGQTVPEQAKDASFQFLPPGLHFAPLKANHQEARIGVFKYFGMSNLKVDIGNTIDVFGLACGSSGVRFTAGIDFFAFAFVTGAQGLRLQVDALDGYFGGNISFSVPGKSGLLHGRFRFLHLSAHLVDGHYNVMQNQWLDNREPIPFTKDFGELIVAHEANPSPSFFRYYGGWSFATHVRPDELKPFSFLAGFELAAGDLIGDVFRHPVFPYIAFHFSLTGHPSYAGNVQLQLGTKFGEWHRKGVLVYLTYYAGNNLFSEYYDSRLSIIGAGFAVDFP